MHKLTLIEKAHHHQDQRNTGETLLFLSSQLKLKTCMPDLAFIVRAKPAGETHSGLFSVCMHPKDHHQTKMILSYFLKSIPWLNKTRYVNCRLSLRKLACELSQFTA
ncbi:hypothetical protein E3U43_001840 [Larimichthys crocea]|uniref:Uncharacterized protein n=1 Tax=Larimichthys crocea TaxID=215358 RepID=A0ACD3RE77_LARCR|nr:hypothetical protein E3U43_001840 [Larimichthys crocea]